ncbi:unnamed protein product [marine sediment metagenome]|uniref:Uncharacterized protein n=1 Tax=marine sediment metagenome TaxID=412755 RepID=X1HU42_9ZZZZ
MPLACGCEIKFGVPVTLEMLRVHYKHTMEAILFWELMHRAASPQDERHFKLSQARIDLLEAIDALYPEAQTE